MRGLPLHAVAQIETLFRAITERGYCSHTFTSALNPTSTDKHQSTATLCPATLLFLKTNSITEVAFFGENI